MKIHGPAKQVRIYIGESDQWHGKPLFSAIVQHARDLGMAGATVTRGIEGFGANSRIHTARLLRLSEDLPIVIDIIDCEERIARLLPLLDEMVTDGLVTISDVHIVRYVANPKSTSRHDGEKDR